MRCVGFVRDDGGREAAGFKGYAGDCVTRAIAIASGTDYKVVYEWIRNRKKRGTRYLDEYVEKYAAQGLDATAAYYKRRKSAEASPRNGVRRSVYEPYILDKGFRKKTPKEPAKLKDAELPGRICIVSMRTPKGGRHMAVVIKGVLHDTWNSKDCRVLQYWYKR